MTSRKRKDDIAVDDNEHAASTTQIGNASASTTAPVDADDSSADGLLPEELVIDGDEDENFDTEFEFFDAHENDYHAVKMYLNSFLDPEEQIDTAELANLICAEASVANVIKVGTEVMGFVAVLPFALFRDIDLGQQLQRVVLARAPPAAQPVLQAAFAASDRLGLLVCERTLNCPPQLVPHLHSLLHEELRATGEETPLFQFDQLLLIASSFRLPASSTAVQKKARAAVSELQFHHFELPAYVEHSAVHFSFPVKPLGQDLRWTWRGNILPHSTVALFPLAAVPQVLAHIGETLHHNTAQ